MSAWLPAAPCDRRCVTPAVPGVSALDRAVRWARLARVLTGTRRPTAVLRALGVRLETNTERLRAPGPTGTLIVANHISWLDVLALLAVEPATFLAKQEMSSWPVLGTLARRVGTLFVDRRRLRALPVTVADVAARLRSGRSVVVFPEGTSWCGPPGGEFRRAPFQAAIDAGAPVRPVTISYRQAGKPSTIAAFVGEDPLVVSVSRVVVAADLAVRVEAHPTITPTAEDRRRLAARAQAAVRRAYAGGPAHG